MVDELVFVVFLLFSVSRFHVCFWLWAVDLCVFSINLLRKRKLVALLVVFLLLYPCMHLFDCVLVNMSM